MAGQGSDPTDDEIKGAFRAGHFFKTYKPETAHEKPLVPWVVQESVKGDSVLPRFYENDVIPELRNHSIYIWKRLR